MAEQQQIYKSEIERIWKAQFDSLSRKDEPELTPEDEERAAAHANQDRDRDRNVKKRRQSVVSAMSPVATTPGPASPAFSRGSSLAREREGSMGPEARNKVLRIRRRVTAHAAFVTRLSTDKFVAGQWRLED